MSKFAFAAVLAASLLSSQAFAGEPAALPSQKISTAGVDFRDPTDVKALYTRLARAADAVCDTYNAHSRVTEADRACATQALANVVRAADKPLLTAEHKCGCSDLLYVARAERHNDQ